MGHDLVEVADEEICDFHALRQSFFAWHWLPRRILPTRALARARGIVLGPDTLSPIALRHLEKEGSFGLADVYQAQLQNDRVTRQWGRFFESFDLLLSPVVTILCPEAEDVRYSTFSHAPLEEWVDDLFDAVPYTIAGNATGLPAIALPAGYDSNGVPLGIQLYGPWAAEADLFNIAGQIERGHPGLFDQRPPNHAGRRR